MDELTYLERSLLHTVANYEANAGDEWFVIGPSKDCNEDSEVAAAFQNLARLGLLKRRVKRGPYDDWHLTARGHEAVGDDPGYAIERREHQTVMRGEVDGLTWQATRYG